MRVRTVEMNDKVSSSWDQGLFSGLIRTDPFVDAVTLPKLMTEEKKLGGDRKDKGKEKEGADRKREAKKRSLDTVDVNDMKVRA